MRAALFALRWILLGAVLLVIAEPAVARPPVIVLRGYYVPSARAAFFRYWPYPLPPAVPLLPRVYDYRGLDPWWGIPGSASRGAYRLGPHELRPPAETAPPSAAAPEVIPAPLPERSGPREF